ncbi:EndoU domain-containing protein [Longispora albida]|uniref:EndoU domain-containing protein n=1 Tax=Longispora albida TaxID=203523 RepID=UPI000367DAE5|nr:EndoU domain-containing protein [Longispora albida]
MAQQHGKRKSTGKLLRAALRYLKEQDGRVAKRNRPDRMNPERLRHMMEGENRKGYHYRPGGEDFPDRRITQVMRRDPNTGVYEAKVEFYKDPPGVWQPKVGQGRSTFFPDHWTPQQCDDAVTNAFTSNNVVKNADGSWTSSVNGVPIMGYYDTATGALKHGFPYL